MNSEQYQKLRYEQLPWIEKYRPKKVDDLVLDKSLKSRIVQFSKDNSLPNLIFTGPPGIGKTSTIRCLAKTLYGEYTKDGVLEINASDGGIKSMQKDLVGFCKTKILYKKDDKDKHPPFKLVILDEADNMDDDRVQPQINSIMESYKDDVRFAFTCNTSSNIIESIQSRCLILMFTRLTPILTSKRLTDIANMEGLKYDAKALNQISELAHGDMRSAVNMLQLVFNKHGSIKLDFISELCDLPQQVIIRKMFDSVIKNDLHTAFKIMFELKNNGYSGSDIALGMIYAIKSDVCKDIEEGLKIKLMGCITNASYRISKGTDSMLQLFSCLTDMVKVE